MCWEDMKHYRESFNQTQEVQQGATLTVPGNPNRIRLIVCGTYNAIVNRTTVFISPGGGAPIGTADNGTPTLVMRLEDYGQLILGPLVINNVGGTGSCSVTEIISREPLSQFADPQQARPVNPEPWPIGNIGR